MLKLDLVQTVALAGLVLFAGYGLRRVVPPLARNNVPAPVIGGLAAAVVILLARRAGAGVVQFDTTLQSPLMIAFFTSIGFGASVPLLRRGGPQVLLILGLATVVAIAQNALGMLLAGPLGVHPLIGVLAGSVTLAGGPATGLAFAADFGKAGVPSAATVAVASAMVGIITAGLVGGPIATWLIRRHRLAVPRAFGAQPGTSLADAPILTPAAIEPVPASRLGTSREASVDAEPIIPSSETGPVPASRLGTSRETSVDAEPIIPPAVTEPFLETRRGMSPQPSRADVPIIAPPLTGPAAETRPEAPESSASSARASAAPGARDTAYDLLKTVVVILATMWVGSLVSQWITAQGVKLPAYIGAMLVAAILRNVDEPTGWIGLSPRTIGDVGGVALALFITMALMTLKLWELVGLAVPLLVILAAQVLMMVAVCLAVFRVMGRDYEAAVMTGGFCGFMLGTTANAVANMEALVERYGPAPRAFLAVPMVGAFFIDLPNAVIITAILNYWR